MKIKKEVKVFIDKKVMKPNDGTTACCCCCCGAGGNLGGSESIN